MQTTVIYPMPAVIDNTSKGFVYYVNNWFSIESMNLLYLQDSEQNVTTT
jgi:hypothetical protein